MQCGCGNEGEVPLRTSKLIYKRVVVYRLTFTPRDSKELHSMYVTTDRNIHHTIPPFPTLAYLIATPRFHRSKRDTRFRGTEISPTADPAVKRT